MRVHPDGIGALHALQEILALVGDGREAAVGGVDVQPDPLRLAEIRHLPERVDRPRAHRAGVGAHRDGVKPRRSVLGHGALEFSHVQTEVFVTREEPYPLGLDADDPRRADVRAVALVAHVDARAIGMTRRFARRDESVQARRRTAAREKTARAFGIADPAPEPVDDDEFELARAARDQPGALVDGVACGHEVGQHAGPGG